MNRDFWRIWVICAMSSLGLVSGGNGLAQELEAGKPVTTKERLPLAGAPIAPTIEVPVVADIDEPDLPESQISSPRPPTPPTPPRVQGGVQESQNLPLNQALRMINQVIKQTPAPVVVTPPPALPSPPPQASPATEAHPPADAVPEKEQKSGKGADAEKQVYLVQVGAMSQVENALNLVEKCQAKGFQAYHLPPDELGGLHRVLIGPHDTKAQADAVAQKWRAAFKGKTLITKK